jgi:hypothetical protein
MGLSRGLGTQEWIRSAVKFLLLACWAVDGRFGVRVANLNRYLLETFAVVRKSLLPSGKSLHRRPVAVETRFRYSSNWVSDGGAGASKQGIPEKSDPNRGSRGDDMVTGFVPAKFGFNEVPGDRWDDCGQVCIASPVARIVVFAADDGAFDNSIARGVVHRWIGIASSSSPRYILMYVR